MTTVKTLTADRIMQLLGDVIVGGSVVDGNLVLRTRNGVEMNVGRVRGDVGPAPHAAHIPFSPSNGVASTNVQDALAELGGDITNLNNVKADKSAQPKFLMGRVLQPQPTANVKSTKEHTNVFPAGYFATAPNVVLTVETTVPERIKYYAVHGVTTRSFSISHLRTTTGDTAYRYLAVG